MDKLNERLILLIDFQYWYEDVNKMSQIKPIPRNPRGLKGFEKDEVIELIHRHSKCTKEILHLIERIPDVVLSNLASQEARKIDKMLKQIFREFERVRQFTRTKLNNHGIIYGEVSFTHKIEDWIIEYFHKRFSKCWLCLYNEKSRSCLVWKGKYPWNYIDSPINDAVKIISRERPLDPYFADIQVENEEIFNIFYKSQFIKSRKNKRYFQQMIPLSARKLPGLKGKVETTIENQKLDKFLLQKQHNRKNKKN